MLHNHNKLFNTLCLLSVITLLSACATTREPQDELTLKPGLGRIAFQQPDRIPNIFKEKLFGRISSLMTETGTNIELNADNNNTFHRFTDVAPGTYTLKAECDPVKNYSGEQINWLVNQRVTVLADQIIHYGCEYYMEDKTKVYGDELIIERANAPWPSNRSDSDRKVRRVRLVELSSQQTR